MKREERDTNAREEGGDPACWLGDFPEMLEAPGDTPAPVSGRTPTGVQLPQRLSTRATFFFKVPFPILVLGLIGVSVGLITPDAPIVALLSLLAFVVVVVLFAKYSFPLKRVTAYDDHLVVSNFITEERVPYEAIAAVREVRWINWRPVIVGLKEPGRFGQYFVFYPYVDSFASRAERPATTFLRSRLTPD